MKRSDFERIKIRKRKMYFPIHYIKSGLYNASKTVPYVRLIDSTCNLGLRLAGMNISSEEKIKLIRTIFKTGQRHIEVGVVGNLENTKNVIQSLKDDFYGEKIVSGIAYSENQTKELISCGGDEIILPVFITSNGLEGNVISYKEYEHITNLCYKHNLKVRALIYKGFLENVPELMKCIMLLKSIGISNFTLIENDHTDPTQVYDTLSAVKSLVYLSNLSVCFISKPDHLKSLVRQFINCETALDVGIRNFIVSSNGLGGLVPTDGMVELLNEREYGHNITCMKPFTTLHHQINSLKKNN